MTREEAIRILSTRDNQGMPVTWQKGFLEAYEMAISAIKAEDFLLRSMIEYLHNTGWMQEHDALVKGEKDE